jgi:hypothetical protein
MANGDGVLLHCLHACGYQSRFAVYAHHGEIILFASYNGTDVVLERTLWG